MQKKSATMDAMPLFLLDDLLKGTPILKSPKTPKEWHLPVFDVEFWDLHFKTWHVLGVSFSHCAIYGLSYRVFC